MKFKFGLERILKHRKTVEEIQARDYAEARLELDKELNRLKLYYESIDGAREEIFKLTQQDSPDNPKMSELDSFIEGQEIRIKRQREVVREKMQIAEEKQEALRMAAIERKILDTLKDKQKENYRIESRKKEQKTIDELVVVRHGLND